MYDNDRPGQPAILVLYICVGFWLLAHLTRDLSIISSSEKKMFLQAEQMHKMTIISLKIVEVVILSENTGHFVSLLSL